MKNIKSSIFLTMIIVSILDIGHCLADEKRIGYIRLINGTGLERLGHSIGFSCVLTIDKKLNFIIEIDQKSYPNIKECMHIHLINGYDKKIYDFNPIIHIENKEGQLACSKLNIKHQNIPREELAKTFKNAPKGVLCVCVVDNRDLHVSINNDIYIFKNISSKNGWLIDQDHLKAGLPMLLPEDLNDIDFKSQSYRAIDEDLYIINRNTVKKTKEITTATDEEIFLRKCLIEHKDSTHIAVSGIPKICEDHALRLQLLGNGTKVETMIAGFKRIMKTGYTK